MKTSYTSFISATLMSVLFFASVPLSAAASSGTGSRERCDRLAGREKTRCEFTYDRTSRLRVRTAARSPIRRNNTVRDKRVIRNSKTQSNIRRIGDHNLNRLRKHDKDGGRARRQINKRDQSARETCKYLKGTEKFQCIRKNWRGLSRGNTR